MARSAAPGTSPRCSRDRASTARIRAVGAAPARIPAAVPSLGAINQVLVLVLFLWTFNDFTTPYVLFGNAAPQAADVISIHIYQASFLTWNFGEGSAMSVLLLLFLLLVTGVYLLVTSRRRSSA